MDCIWWLAGIRAAPLQSTALISLWIYFMPDHINILVDQFALRSLPQRSNTVSRPLEGISKASKWQVCLSVCKCTLAESMWKDCNQSLWVTCTAWTGLYASSWTTGKWLCAAGIQLGPHVCSSASANHTVDIKLDCIHIQDAVHFNLITVAFAEYHGCCQGGRDVYSYCLFKCHMGDYRLSRRCGCSSQSSAQITSKLLCLKAAEAPRAAVICAVRPCIWNLLRRLITWVACVFNWSVICHIDRSMLSALSSWRPPRRFSCKPRLKMYLTLHQSVFLYEQWVKWVCVTWKV